MISQVRILIMIAMVGCASMAAAQSARDTIYYDRDWKKATASEYYYYRIVTPRGGKLNVEDHYRSGHIQMTGSYLQLEPKEIADGHFLYFSDGGVKTRDENYKNGLLEGEYFNYDTAGHLTLKMYFKHDKWDGHRTAYYTSGKIYRDEIYKDGKWESGKVFDENGKELAFYPIEELPEYPGGDTAMISFVQRNLKYPEPAQVLNIEGTVKVKFLVGTDGMVEDAVVIESKSVQLNEAALDVVRKFPRFKPGKQEGKAVKCSFVLPVTFRLVEADKKK